MVLAALTTEDAGEVLTLQRAAFVTEAQAHKDVYLAPLMLTLADLYAELKEPSSYGWGIRQAGRLVACIRARATGTGAEIIRLAVAPDRQGQGLGTSLLLAVEPLLPPEVEAIRLFTGGHSEANLRFYRRHGYRETHRTQAGDYLLVHFLKDRLERDPISPQDPSMGGTGTLTQIAWP